MEELTRQVCARCEWGAHDDTTIWSEYNGYVSPGRPYDVTASANYLKKSTHPEEAGTLQVPLIGQEGFEFSLA